MNRASLTIAVLLAIPSAVAGTIGGNGGCYDNATGKYCGRATRFRSTDSLDKGRPCDCGVFMAAPARNPNVDAKPANPSPIGNPKRDIKDKPKVVGAAHS